MGPCIKLQPTKLTYISIVVLRIDLYGVLFVVSCSNWQKKYKINK